MDKRLSEVTIGDLEAGRMAVERALADLRQARVSTLGEGVRSGVVIAERNGAPSDVIRLTVQEALAIALRAIRESAEEPVNTSPAVSATRAEIERVLNGTDIQALRHLVMTDPLVHALVELGRRIERTPGIKWE